MAWLERFFVALIREGLFHGLAGAVFSWPSSGRGFPPPWLLERVFFWPCFCNARGRAPSRPLLAQALIPASRPKLPAAPLNVAGDFKGGPLRITPMAQFKFKMDFMISLRKRREEEAAIKLAKRLASIRELERVIQSLNGDLAETGLEMTRKGQAGELNGPLMVMYSSHMERVREDIKKHESLLYLSRKEEFKERQALRKAVTDRKIMEKVKERQKEAWLEETARQEQNAIEELAAITKERSRRNEAADGDV